MLDSVPPEMFLDGPPGNDLLLQRTLRQIRSETGRPAQPAPVRAGRGGRGGRGRAARRRGLRRPAAGPASRPSAAASGRRPHRAGHPGPGHHVRHDHPGQRLGAAGGQRARHPARRALLVDHRGRRTARSTWPAAGWSAPRARSPAPRCRVRRSSTRPQVAAVTVRNEAGREFVTLRVLTRPVAARIAGMIYRPERRSPALDDAWWRSAVVYQIYPRSFADSERRRHRRPAGHHRAAGPPGRARRRRALAVPGLPVAAGRQRLRHQRLHRHRAGVRHPGRLRRAAGRGARARHEAGHGPGGQPHLRRAPLVRRVARQHRQPEAGLVLVAPGAGHRLGVVLLRPGLGSWTRPPASTTCTCSPASSPT